MSESVSIAIETSCRSGGVALGVGDRLVDHIAFDASRRHAGQLIGHLADMLGRAELSPGDISSIYVSAGPGGFTGLRVGITVARTLGQFIDGAQCVAVPTHLAVAENARDLSWDRVGVVLDAGEGCVNAMILTRDGEDIVPDGPAATAPTEQFAAAIPRPILLIGEGLRYHEVGGEGVTLADEDAWLPTAEGVWHVGQRLAGLGRLTPYHDLLPIYVRPAAAERARQQG